MAEIDLSGNSMKKIGITLLVLGVAGIIYACNMKTTVEIDDWKYGIHTKASVNNIGLMDKRRNVLILSGLSMIGGIILFGIGSIKGSHNPDELKTCPYCAEKIKKDAKICRFCNCELPEEIKNSKNKYTEEELKKLGVQTFKCELCGSVFPTYDLEVYKGKKVCTNCKESK